MDEIRKFIDNISPMNDSDWQFFSSKLQEVKLGKNTTLLKIGEVENHLSFQRNNPTLYSKRRI